MEVGAARLRQSPPRRTSDRLALSPERGGGGLQAAMAAEADKLSAKRELEQARTFSEHRTASMQSTKDETRLNKRELEQARTAHAPPPRCMGGEKRRGNRGNR